VGLYLCFCLVLFLMQRRMMYFPTQLSEDRALLQASAEGLEPWRDVSGRLLGWRCRHPGAAPQVRLLVLHGNAGMALDRTYFAAAFHGPSVALPIDLYVLEYPGYGPRKGEPSERTLVQAAVEALDALASRGPTPIWVLGESIGSGVACQLAAARPGRVAGLVLVTPMDRLASVQRHHYPWIPGLLLRDRYDSEAALRGFSGPVAFLVAGRDEVVPAALGLRLHGGFGGRKRLWVESEAGHNTLDYRPGRPLWGELIAFLAGRSSGGA